MRVITQAAIIVVLAGLGGGAWYLWQQYAENGAAAVSVLTDESYFMGHLEHLTAVRVSVPIPVLRKDFIIDPLQIEEARSAGADAALLIVMALEDAQLADLHTQITDFGMSALVEVHNEEELERALAIGATLIGVNNRDLRTFHTDLEHTLRLREQVPDDCVLVAESGIRTQADVQRLAAAGVQAMLVGESLMVQADIGQAVDKLLGR